MAEGGHEAGSDRQLDEARARFCGRPDASYTSSALRQAIFLSGVLVPVLLGLIAARESRNRGADWPGSSSPLWPSSSATRSFSTTCGSGCPTDDGVCRRGPCAHSSSSAGPPSRTGILCSTTACGAVPSRCSRHCSTRSRDQATRLDAPAGRNAPLLLRPGRRDSPAGLADGRRPRLSLATLAFGVVWGVARGGSAYRAYYQLNAFILALVRPFCSYGATVR